jgi:acyl transferase domain-containing protein
MLMKDERKSKVTTGSDMRFDELGCGQTLPVPPIAIVGMAMRLPGDVRTAEDFWELLISKRDCSSEVPKSRYNIDAFYHPDKPQSVKTRRGYFLHDDYMQKSDKSFFSPIPGFTTSDLDPQQMQLMEVIWECMENAGQTDWRGKKIGCYVGVFGEDWHELTAKEPQEVTRVHTFANGGFTLSNRVSYEFDLKGPR